MTLTPRDIEDRFEEAAYTLRRLPEKDRPRGYRSSWPPIVQEAKHAYGYTPEAPMRVIPSAAAISRMEECFDWLMLIDPQDARIVWLRADRMRWRQVCIRAGVVRSNAWRRWAAALLTIAKKLNSQTKTKRKLKAPDQPRAIPRESVVNTQDNPQNTLNFRRDISSGSEA
ncbi:MAG: DUF6362 family protein [Cypionkella sp.]